MFLIPDGELPHVLRTYGYGAVGGLVALESMGIPLPGETILIAAAVLAGTQHVLNIWFVVASAAGGAIIGDSIGFLIGREVGYWLLLRYGSYVRLTVPRIKLGQYMFLRYGGAVVFFGRFVSVLRCLAAFLAGANRMHWPHFFAFNAAGGIVWATAYGLGAYLLGKTVSHLAAPVGIAIGVIAVAAVIAAGWFLHRHEAELEKRAEVALPGPLEPVRLRDRG